MNKKVLALALVAVVVVAAIGVVIYNGSQNKTTADITIACGTKNCYEPFWIANDKGYFADEGVTVEMKYTDGGGSATTMLLSGNADLTLVGADPAIRLFESKESGYAIATIETSKSGKAACDFAYNNTIGIDLDDATTFFNPDGSIKVHCGLDTTTGYFSGYISYLYNQLKNGIITEEQFATLKTVKTNDKDGGIVHVSFENQAASLDGDSVQMICSGNTVAVADGMPNITTGSSSEFKSVVGGCVIIVSDEAYDNKSDELVKVLRALDKACKLIEDESSVDDTAKFCADWYGADGWTEERQKKFFESYYWDICNMTSMVEYLEYKAALLGYDHADYEKFVKTDLVVKAHEDISLYGGLYTYDYEQGKLIAV